MRRAAPSRYDAGSNPLTNENVNLGKQPVAQPSHRASPLLPTTVATRGAERS